MFVAGCASNPISTCGVVGWGKEFSTGSFAPDIPFTLADGEQTTLHKVREPVAIIAFVSTWTNSCCKLRTDLLSLREQFHVLPITVVQIALPVGRCSDGPNCSEISGFDSCEFISLCDDEGIAWRAYGHPELNTLILVDQNSKVVDIGNTANSKKLVEKAYWMARRIDDRDYIDD